MTPIAQMIRQARAIPVIVIDDDIYGNVDPKQVPSILAKYH